MIVDKADDASLGEVHYMPAGVNVAIDEVKSDAVKSTGRYNLLGQPVSESYRGIVIENGKKVIK